MRKKIEEKKWRDILSDISENVTEVSYRSWFAPLVPMEIDEDAAVIYFATSKSRSWKYWRCAIFQYLNAL